MTRTVVFHLLCPGEMQDQRHTPYGKEQVLSAVAKHLRNITLDAAYCSTTSIAKETAEMVLYERNETLDIVPREAFSHAEELLQGILDVANELVSTDPMRRQPWHVLVGYDAAFAGLAEVDSTRIGAIGPAVIIQHSMRHNGNGWRLISSTHIPCPLAERSAS